MMNIYFILHYYYFFRLRKLFMSPVGGITTKDGRICVTDGCPLGRRCPNIYTKMPFCRTTRSQRYVNVHTYIHIRHLIGLTDQADPSFFYFRISLVLMGQCCCFYFFHPLHFVQGLRSKNLKQAITTLLFKLGKSQGPFFNH